MPQKSSPQNSVAKVHSSLLQSFIWFSSNHGQVSLVVLKNCTLFNNAYVGNNWKVQKPTVMFFLRCIFKCMNNNIRGVNWSWILDSVALVSSPCLYCCSKTKCSLIKIPTTSHLILFRTFLTICSAISAFHLLSSFMNISLFYYPSIMAVASTKHQI